MSSYYIILPWIFAIYHSNKNKNFLKWHGWWFMKKGPYITTTKHVFYSNTHFTTCPLLLGRVIGGMHEIQCCSINVRIYFEESWWWSGTITQLGTHVWTCLGTANETCITVGSEVSDCHMFQGFRLSTHQKGASRFRIHNGIYNLELYPDITQTQLVHLSNCRFSRTILQNSKKTHENIYKYVFSKVKHVLSPCLENSLAGPNIRRCNFGCGIVMYCEASCSLYRVRGSSDQEKDECNMSIVYNALLNVRLKCKVTHTFI